MSKEKSGNWFVRHKVLTVIGVTALIGIAASGAGGGSARKEEDEAKTTTSTSAKASTEEETKFKAGDVIAFDGKEVTVSTPERNWSSGNSYIVPDSGNEYVKVQVAIENKSDNQASYNTFDWKLQNSNGVIKDVDAMTYGTDGALGSGELAAGGKVSGFLVFQVPSGDQGLVLKYSPSFWSDKKVEVTL